MQKPIVTALLAYGMSGKLFHAPFVNFHDGFDFKGVFEHNNKRVRADYPDVQSFDSIDEVLNDSEIELVIVNTPSNLHVEHTRKALLAGKHVLVEKPFAPTAEEARKLFELGRKVGKKVMIYQNRRYSSDFAVTKQLIQSGRLGHIIEMHLRYDRYRAEIGPKAFKENPFPAAGVVYDLAAHLLDQVIGLMGKPERFYKTTGIYRQNSKVDDYGHIHLIYPGQTNIFITTSLLVADPLPGIVIHGSKGSFIKSFCDSQEDQLIAGMKPGHADFGKEAENQEGRLTTVDENGQKKTELIPSERGRYIDLFEEVFQVIRNDAKYSVNEEEVLTQLEILQS